MKEAIPPASAKGVGGGVFKPQGHTSPLVPCHFEGDMKRGIRGMKREGKRDMVVVNKGELVGMDEDEVETRGVGMDEDEVEIRCVGMDEDEVEIRCRYG